MWQIPLIILDDANLDLRNSKKATEYVSNDVMEFNFSDLPWTLMATPTLHC